MVRQRQGMLGVSDGSGVPAVAGRPLRDADWYRMLALGAADALVLHDLDGRIVEVNRRAEALLGWDRADLVGRSLAEFEEDATPERFEERAVRLAAQRAATFEVVLRRRDGATFPAELRAALVPDHGARYVHALVRDVTTRRWDDVRRARRDALETAAAEAARGFASGGDVDLADALRLLGRALSATRGWLLRRAGADLRLVSEWTAHATEPALGALAAAPAAALGEVGARLAAGETVALTSVEALGGPGAPARHLLATAGVRAALLAPVPSAAGEGLDGVLGFDETARDREWTAEEARAAGALARMVAGHWQRRETQAALRESEARVRQLLEHAGDALLVHDPEGRILDANDRASGTLGWTTGELRTLSLADLAPALDAAAARAATARAAAGPAVTVEALAHRRDGTTFPAEFRIGRLDSGGRAAFASFVRDVSERKRVEDELRRSNADLAEWVDRLERRSREISRINEMGALLQVCQSAAEAYDVIARSAAQLFPSDAGAVYVVDEERSLVEAVAHWGAVPPPEVVWNRDDCWALRRGRVHHGSEGGRGLVCPHVHHPPAGGHLCVPLVAQGDTLGLLHVRSAAHPDSSPDAVQRGLSDARERLAVTAADHIALALANLTLRETLRTQAIRDPLTGLFNRRYMEESLARELHRAMRRGMPVGVIMLDIDHFKLFNDRHGHAAGDAILRQFGAFLRAQVRGEDIACRYGGEEFVLILLDSPLEGTVTRAEQLREGTKKLRLEHHFATLGPITVSLGVAAVPAHGTTKDAIMGAADSALYKAKGGGRDCVHVAQLRRK